MATTKIKTVKARLDKIINYITNPEKQRTAHSSVHSTADLKSHILK